MRKNRWVFLILVLIVSISLVSPWLFKKKTPPNTYYLSSYGVSNTADLLMESTTFGTDQTAKIQNILNKATKKNPIIVIWDVKCAITQIRIKSYTTILVNSNCGAIQITGTNNQMIVNYHKVDSTNNLNNFTRRDSNITMIGGIWNQNASISGVQNQLHNVPSGFNQIMRFSGVVNLNLSNMTLRNGRTYNLYVNNFYKVNAQNIKFELPSTVVSLGNHDGFKIGGPGKNLIAINIHGVTRDDMMSVCANDGLKPTTAAKLDSTSLSEVINGITYKYPYFDAAATYGALDSIYINNVTFETGTEYGFRFLATTDTLKNVVLNGLHGHTKHGIIESTTWPNCYGSGSSNNVGYYKNLTIKNVDATLDVSSWYDYYAWMYFSGVYQNLQIKTCKRTDAAVYFPYIYFEQGMVADSILVQGVKTTATNNVTSTIMDIVNSGLDASRKLTLDSVDFDRGNATTNSSYIYGGYNNYGSTLIFRNTYTSGISNCINASMLHWNNFNASHITFNNSNNGTVFYNTTTYGTYPASTIIRHITRDAGSTLLYGNWNGQDIIE